MAGSLPAAFTGLELWSVDLAATAAALDEVERRTPRLAAADAGRLAAIAAPDVRRERRAAHIALRVLLERAFGTRVRGVPFATSVTGKPALPGIAGDFSLSHCPGSALVGLAASGAIGVDIEERRPVRIGPERRRRLIAAAAALAPCMPLPAEPEARLLQAWVRLEAVAKADGRGMGRLLTALGLVGSRYGAPRPAGAAPALARFEVRDVAAGEALFAAVAVSPGAGPMGRQALPATAEAIARLVD